MDTTTRDPAAERRGCYCGRTEHGPDDPPEGYCGWCQVCGRPGHMRHAPGAPVTGAWCTRHWRLLCWFHPLAPIGKIVWITLAVGAVVLWQLLR